MADNVPADQGRQNALERILRAAAGSSARLVAYGAAAAAIYSISGGDLTGLALASPALARLVEEIGGDVLAGMLDRVAHDETLAPEQIRTLLQESLAGVKLDEVLTGRDFHLTISRLQRQAQERHGIEIQLLQQILAQLTQMQAPQGEIDLDAALAQLEAMPLDQVPSVASLPPGSRMPLSPNPLFVGRQEDLKQIATALKGGDTAAIGQIAAATGLGGIGKTQLAVEFAYRYGQYFAGGVFWLSFADPAAVRAEAAACGEGGGLDLPAGFSGLPLDDQVRLVRSAWASPLPRLLIFDNCEEEATLAEWRPPTGGCRVLVTSRRATWGKIMGVQTISLGVLSRAESIALLHKHRPDLAEDDADLDAIAKELGDLPLALHLAGSYLETYQDDPDLGSPADFLDELRGARLLEHPALKGEDVTRSATDHLLHVGRTFALSYERLDPDDPTDGIALALLARAACFAPGQPIPRDLLLATLRPAESDRTAARQAARGLNRLVGLGLLQKQAEGALVLHRLLAAFVQGLAADEGAQTAVEETLYVEANRLNEAGYPAPLLAWQSHLRAVTDAARARQDERGAGLCNQLGYHLRMIGDYTGARPYYERALAIREKVLGPDHPATAGSLNNLGMLHQAIGDLAGARLYLERALAIWEKVLGPDHPATALSLNNLGALLQDLGDLAGARPYIERALAIRKKVLDPDHPDTATSLNNLGALLQAMGDLAGARPCLERALAIWEKALGPDHPATATSLNNLVICSRPWATWPGRDPITSVP